MTFQEYIRTDPSPASSRILSVPLRSGTATLTFLHAGHSHWPASDSGRSHSSERGHAHPVYHIVLYTAGYNSMLHNGIREDCVRGTVLFTNPGMLHEYRPQESGGASFLEVTFNLRQGDNPVTLPFQEILLRWFGLNDSLSSQPFLVPPPHFERLESLMIDLIDELNGEGMYQEVAASLVLGQFLLEFIRYVHHDERFSARGSDKIEKARYFLERGFSRSFSMEVLAEIACMSQAAFIRLFSRRYGAPPMQYRKKLRLTAAQHLLSFTGRSIGEIAVNVGYKDIQTFSRSFSAELGISPSAWRRTYREGKEAPREGL